MENIKSKKLKKNMIKMIVWLVIMIAVQKVGIRMALITCYKVFLKSGKNHLFFQGFCILLGFY